MKSKKIISVILPLKLEWEPYYSLAGDMETSIGDRVKVMFAGRIYTAVVSATDVIPETATSRIKEVLSIEQGMNRITKQEMELWRRVADYYMCTIGEVYKAAYPYGKTELEEAKAISAKREKERENLKKENRIERLTKKIESLKLKVDKNLDLASRARKETTRAAYFKSAEVASNEIKSIELQIKELSTSVPHPTKTLTGTLPDRQPLTLSSSQKTALEQIKTIFGIEKPVLLHGVTGSGKTEIYMSLALDSIEQNKNVLYLVPEIALSRQLEDRLRRIFGDSLLVFHSGESSASRRNTADRLRAGRGHLILGTRSSLFLPHHDLGLIIVDEEHDNSYKQDSPAPRYNGRDTALMLSVIHKCSIILGSATPSLEEIYNCQTGRHSLVELKERFHGSADAEIEIIDTKAERKKNGMVGSFSRKLIRHIEKTLSEGGQILILRSRRAWSPAMQCSNCGDIPKCPHCNVSLSLHKDGSLRCHYCGIRFSNVGRCHRCGGTMNPLGSGTQKIEEEAASLFPESRIVRLDSDSAQNRNNEKRIIKDFSDGKADILIGTQMVSKGFDFSNLSLVAVIAADSLLGMQDFRADERAGQMLEQLRGRCGRRERRGLFVIQTSNPEHPIYRNISGEGNGLSWNLMIERQDFNFPPYTRMIEISIRDRYKDRAESMAFKLAATIRNRLRPSDHTKHDLVTGPYSPAVDKIADHHIRTIRINMPKNKELAKEKSSLKECIDSFEKAMKYEGHITVNVDPS